MKQSSFPLIRPAAPAAMLALVILLCAGVPCRADDRPVLVSVKITGAHAVSRGEIRRVMRTKLPSWFSWVPFVKDPPFNESVLRADVARVRDLYYARGYFRAEMTPEVRWNRNDTKAAVTLRIEEGPPSRIRAVQINISETLPGTLEKELRSAVNVRPGMVFTVENYDASLRTLNGLLSNNGFLQAAVTRNAVVIKDRNAVDISFDVAPGPVKRFGSVFLYGNETVDDKFILQELAFRRGDIYSDRAVARSQRNIFRLDLFRSVVLTPIKDIEGDEVPLDIEVEERLKRNFDLGIGYGDEDQFRIHGLWRRRYFLGEPRTLSVSARYSTLYIGGAMDIDQPHFLELDTSLSLHAGYDRENMVSYSNERIATQARLTRRFRESLQAYFGYNLEINRPISASRELVNVLKAAAPGDYYFISGVVAGARYDTTPNEIYPVRGGSYSVYIEPTSFLLGSQVDYLRGIVEVRQYAPLREAVVAGIRVRVGFIEPLRFTKVIPVFKRFFAGGSNSIRGYAFQSLGPLDASGNPVGGNYLLETNTEIRYPVYKNLYGAVFFDGGNVFSDHLELNFDSLRYATGLGIRYRTIVGPLRLDVAFPLEPFPEIDLEKYRIYFSIGNVF